MIAFDTAMKVAMMAIVVPFVYGLAFILYKLKE